MTEDLDLVEEADQFTHLITVEEIKATDNEEMLSEYQGLVFAVMV